MPYCRDELDGQKRLGCCEAGHPPRAYDLSSSRFN